MSTEPDMTTEHHEHAKEISRRYVRTGMLSSLSTALLTLAAAVGIWQAIGRDLMVNAIAQEAAAQAAEDLDTKIADAVEDKIEPIRAEVAAGNQGLKAVIMGNITSLENDISALEFLRDYRDTEWNDERRRELLSKNRAIAAQREALAAIVTAERANGHR